MATPTPPKGGDITDELGSDTFDAFKDAMGRFRTKSLFIESPNPAYPAFFTMKRYDFVKDGHTYLSLYKRYIEICDPTEYQVAIRLFGSWDHWKALMRSKWFMLHLRGWRAEVLTKIESECFYEMKGYVTSDPTSTQSMQATKWLAGRYGDSKALKRGRPSKSEKEAALKQETEDDRALSEDAARIGLDNGS